MPSPTTVKTNTRTPDDLAIRQRDLQFGRETTHPRWWVRGDPVATAFFNALSATFPLGERFFMDSVKAFRHKTDGKLAEQVKAFLFQEAMHSREHVVFNQMAEQAGYDMKPLEETARRHIAIGRSRPPLQQLAATCALEHFTAILANALLADPRHLDGVPEEAARMWRWHAMEEIEHKAVAYDTYMAAMKDYPAAFRWLRRSVVMVVATGIFIGAIGSNIKEVFRQDGIDNKDTWRRLRRFLWVEPGIARTVLKSYFSYYRPGFHPWQEDDRALLAQTEKSLAASPAASPAPVGVPA